MSKINFIKTAVCAMIVVLLCPTDLFANDGDSIVYKKLREANKLLLSGGQEKAYTIYREYAGFGNQQAMNAMGILLQRGWGVEKDEAASVQWFERAADNGYTRAYGNLAQIYAKGLGVEQDFSKAAYYYEKLIPANPRWAKFRLGYYHYKGLGVEQDYEKAVDYFQQAAEKGSADAYFFLGLCCRNGYGVARDEGEAQYYLQKAAEMGHYYSKQELAEETPETQTSHQQLRMKSAGVQNSNTGKAFRKIAKQNVKGKISGEYEGTLVTYDYSGKQVVREVPLKLSFSEPDIYGNVKGRWTEADSLTAFFEAALTDTTLQFVNTSYARTDHYNKTALKWNFTKAMLEKTDIDGEIFLAGNVQMYSPKNKEPEKPMYISLKQSKTGVSTLRAYPIQESNDINVAFELSTEKDVTINVYTLNGILLFTQSLGQLNSGKHQYSINADIPKGNYILFLQRGNEKTTTIIHKN